MKSKYIDITFPLSQKLPVWPGSIGYSYQLLMRMPQDGNNLSSITLDNHTGTHLDAPLHFVENGKAVHDLDLNKLIGKVFVAEIRGQRVIDAQLLEEFRIPKSCNKLILKTDNQIYWEKGETEFQKDFCALDKSGSQWIVNRGIHFVGIDYLSIQRFDDGPETHQILLESEVIIAESLNLLNVPSAWYELICLPLLLENLEGSPVRAILKYTESN